MKRSYYYRVSFNLAVLGWLTMPISTLASNNAFKPVSINEMVILSADSIKDTQEWNIINDTVMGGRSTSKISSSSDRTVVFSGFLSLENNGGFSSIRSDPWKINLSGYSGLSLSVKGDGRSYKMTMKTDRSWDGVSYHYEFKTRKDEWIAVFAPFDKFIPRFRGRFVPSALPFETDKVQTIGFMISDKQEGEFALEIKEIKAVAQNPNSHDEQCEQAQ